MEQDRIKKKSKLSELAPGTAVRLAVYGRHNTCAYFDSRVLEISEVDRPYLSSKNFENIIILFHCHRLRDADDIRKVYFCLRDADRKKLY